MIQVSIGCSLRIAPLASAFVCACGGGGADECGEYGCELSETFQVRDGSESRTATTEWAGEALSLRGSLREVTIIRGKDDATLGVEFRPQARLPMGAAQDDVDEEAEGLATEVDVRDDVTVVEARGSSGVSAKLIVSLPRLFDSSIRIEKGAGLHGDVELRFVGSARELIIDSESTGMVRVDDAETLRDVFIFAKGDVVLAPFSAEGLHQVSITTDLGNVEAVFSRLPRTSAALVSRSGGDVEVELTPAQGFELDAVAEDGVDLEDVPEHCEGTERDGVVRLACATENIEAPSAFHMESSRKVKVRFR